MTRTYLNYTGSGIYAELGLCAAVPRAGERVEIDGVRYVVVRVEWHVYTTGDNTDRVPQDYYPQQCATVHVRRARRPRRSRGARGA